MKKVIIFLIIILMFGFYNTTSIVGEYAGGGGGNSAVIPDAESTDKWTWDSTYRGAQGLKISVYKKNGTLLRTKAFVNNKDQVKSLNESGIMVKQENTKRLSLSIEKGSWAKSGSNYFQYLDYRDYVNKSTYVDIVKLLKGTNEIELVQKLGVETYSNTQLQDLVLVIEPATTFRNKTSSGSADYFGTYWEFMWMYTNKTSEGDFRWQFSSWFFKPGPKNVFSENLKIKNDEISETKTPEIWKFLGTKFTAFRSKVTTEDSLGVAIILLSDVIDIETTEIPCNTSITKGSCDTDYLIKEPKNQACVLNNEKYKYQAITECGVVYCSQEISTDLDDFYKTFDPIIKAGRYFKMNPIKMNITKTCYLKASNNNSSCNNWQTMIRTEDAGNVKLSLISDYILIKDINSFKAECNSRSGNKCTQATVTQHIEYILEPTTNKFISIKDMAGTATGPGNDVIEQGGPTLTTPISFASGTHNYSLDFTGTPLYATLKRLSNETIDSSDGNYTLNYSYSPALKETDFLYSCPYIAENPNGCVCTDECCDNECNPIPCDCNPIVEPCGFPNFVYRPINLEEAFPGEDGKGRDYGSNWKGDIKDETGNVIKKPNGMPYTKEEYYINFNRGYDDYDVYRAEPLYVINLDYNTMKAIREYNDNTNHDYNNSTLTCDNGEKCISNFLRGNVKGFNINLIASGTCQTINYSTFNSCISRK